MNYTLGVIFTNSSPSLGLPGFLLCYFLNIWFILKYMILYILFLNIWFDFFFFFWKWFGGLGWGLYIFAYRWPIALVLFVKKLSSTSIEFLLYFGQKSSPLLASVDTTWAGRRDTSQLLSTRLPPALLGWPGYYWAVLKVLTPLGLLWPSSRGGWAPPYSLAQGEDGVGGRVWAGEAETLHWAFCLRAAGFSVVIVSMLAILLSCPFAGLLERRASFSGRFFFCFCH